MQITSIEAVTQRFPDGTKSGSGSYRIMFSAPGIVKRIGVQGIKNSSGFLSEIEYQLLRAKVEATRDALFAEHGNDWRKHEQKVVLSEDEKSLLLKAVE